MIVVVGSTAVSQSPQVAEAVVVGSTTALSQSAQVSVLVVAGSTGSEVVVDSQSAQSMLDEELVVAGSTGVEELQSSQVNDLEVVAATELVVAGLTGVSLVVVVVLVVFPSTGVLDVVETAVAFQSTQVSRATCPCSLACMFFTWLEAETVVMTAAPAAAIVTAFILTEYLVDQCP